MTFALLFGLSLANESTQGEEKQDAWSAVDARSGRRSRRPGANPDWLPANKTGFGTSYTTASNVWFTLQGGRLSEVYYPRLDTPSVRNLDFVVTDGQSFALRAQDAPTSTRLVNPHLGRRKDGDDPESLTYQIVKESKEP
jgi:hypothetical protein